MALSWTINLLRRNPAVGARLLAELDSVLGEPGSGRLPTLQDLPRLPYTRRVFAESLRLYPPAWVTARIAAAEAAIEGERIRKGDSVIVSQYVTHRDPRWWPDPEHFDPDRFLDEVEATRPKFAYFPFGGGPPRCIGEQFAWMEGHLLLASMLHRFRLHVDPEFKPVLEPRITLRPATGIPVTVEARR